MLCFKLSATAPDLLSAVSAQLWICLTADISCFVLYSSARRSTPRLGSLPSHRHSTRVPHADRTRTLCDCFITLLCDFFQQNKTMDNDGLPLYPQVYPNAVIDRKEVPGAPVGAQVPAPLPPMHPQLLGPENTVTTCQFCRASIKTAVKYTTTARTHIAAALWGLLCCLCCVPYGAESAKNSDHYCPNCQRYLGTYVK